MNTALLKELGLRGITDELKECDPYAIAAFERTLGRPLPDDYREFLWKYSPSCFSQDVAYVPIECSPWASNGLETIDAFYGISDVPGFDIRNAHFILGPDLPSGTIAIGYDAGSNHLLLSLDTGSILFMDNETGNTTLSARTFSAFLEAFITRS